MTVCEMCGRSGDLVTAEVEGVELKVCPLCTKFGKIIRKVSWQHAPPKPIATGPEFKIVDDFAALIRSIRNAKNMSQEDFGKLIQERESAIAKWEQGTLKPSLDAARRVGKILSMNFVKQEEVSSTAINTPAKKSDEFTLGDFIKMRKKK